MPGIDPGINATLSAVRHLSNGCTTMHHNNWGEEPNLLKNAEKIIQGYMKTGIRITYSPGGRNMNTLALDDEDIIMELKLAYNLHRVSGYEGEVGEFRPGMSADAVLVDLDEMLNEPWV